MVKSYKLARSATTGGLYVFAIFLITTGISWIQNPSGQYPWYAGLAAIAVGALLIVVDHYYRPDTTTP